MDQKKFTDFYDAWWYLITTAVFWHEEMILYGNREEFGLTNHFEQSLDINVVKVNPKNNKIDDDESKNTKVRIWLECGEPYKCENTGEIMFNSHNYNYDCGGDTFEEAIIEMANLVWKKNEK